MTAPAIVVRNVVAVVNVEILGDETSLNVEDTESFKSIFLRLLEALAGQRVNLLSSVDAQRNDELSFLVTQGNKSKGTFIPRGSAARIAVLLLFNCKTIDKGGVGLI